MTKNNSAKGKTVRETLKKTAFRTLDCPPLGWGGEKLLNITITSLLTICLYVVKDISVQQYDFLPKRFNFDPQINLYSMAL